VIEEYIARRTPDITGELLADLGTTVTLDSEFRGGYATDIANQVVLRVAAFLGAGVAGLEQHDEIASILRGDPRAPPNRPPCANAYAGPLPVPPRPLLLDHSAELLTR
jgi:hypothetical protein